MWSRRAATHCLPVLRVLQQAAGADDRRWLIKIAGLFSE